MSSDRDERRATRRAAIVPLAILAGALLLGALIQATPAHATLFGIEGPRCPSTYILGPYTPGAVGCPGCGLTRGTALLLDGQFAAATRLQPASWVVVLFAACGAVLYAAILATGQEPAWIDRVLRTGRLTFAACVMLAWLTRLV